MLVGLPVSWLFPGQGEEQRGLGRMPVTAGSGPATDSVRALGCEKGYSQDAGGGAPLSSITSGSKETPVEPGHLESLIRVW